MLRYDRQLAWFSHLVRHPARKRSGSILTTRSPHAAHKELKETETNNYAVQNTVK